MRPNSFATFILFDGCFVAITVTIEIEKVAGDAGSFRVYNLMTHYYYYGGGEERLPLSPPHSGIKVDRTFMVKQLTFLR